MDTELGLNVGDRYNIALLVSKNAYQVFSAPRHIAG